eukprot:12523587-Ditylum_brightwellii.AAC.1
MKSYEVDNAFSSEQEAKKGILQRSRIVTFLDQEVYHLEKRQRTPQKQFTDRFTNTTTDGRDDTDYTLQRCHKLNQEEREAHIEESYKKMGSYWDHPLHDKHSQMNSQMTLLQQLTENFGRDIKDGIYLSFTEQTNKQRQHQQQPRPQ